MVLLVLMYLTTRGALRIDLSQYNCIKALRVCFIIFQIIILSIDYICYLSSFASQLSSAGRVPHLRYTLGMVELLLPSGLLMLMRKLELFLL